MNSTPFLVLASCVGVMLQLAFVAAKPHRGGGGGGMMMGADMVMNSLVEATMFGPSSRSGRMMRMLETECFKRLNIAVPATLANQPSKSENPSSSYDGERNKGAPAMNLKDITYDMVKSRAMEMLANVSKPMDDKLAMIDTMMSSVAETTKFMGTLSQQQMKDMLMCLHTMALVEPLEAEKKGVTMAKRLTCEVRTTLMGQNVNQCPKA